ncbi:MAG: enoyl-CoA hydratase/isomerase family protein [Streptosporangiales bacterium]
MASTAPLRYTRADGVVTITLTRPEQRNSLDTATKEALRDALAEAAGDSTARCVVLAGEGKAFSVGQDLREHAELLGQDNDAVWNTVPEHYNPIVLAIATMTKPVIAALGGIAAGAGAGFAFAADIRMLGESAGFNLAFAGVGLSADSGASWTLPRLVGYGRATELLLRPRTVGAAEALAIGLANRVVPDGRLADEVSALAQELAQGPTLAYAAIRNALAYSAGHGLADSLAHEAELQAECGSTADHRAAVDAFLRKEHPEFHGR